MPGGLVQIAVYGTQDLMLTGTPQITFFKLIYRRYTNFAIEPIQQILEGYADFGRNLTSQIDKVGDLIHKTYLEIDIPQISLLKNPNQYILNADTANLEYTKSFNLYSQVRSYIAADTALIRYLYILLNINNITMNEIIQMMASTDTSTVIGCLTTALITQRNNLISYINTYIGEILTLKDMKDALLYQINRVDILIVFNSIIATVPNVQLPQNADIDATLQRTKLNSIIYGTLFNELNDFNNTFNQDLLAKEQVNTAFQNGTYTESYKFAWVKELWGIQ